MKTRFLVALAFSLFAVAALAATRSVTIQTTLTGNGCERDPNGANPPPGIVRLNNAQGYRTISYFPDGGTFAGAGSFAAQFCPNANSAQVCAGQWPRNPALDDTVTVTATSCMVSDGGATRLPCPAIVFPDHSTNPFGDGWLCIFPVGVTGTLADAGPAGAATPLNVQVDVQGNQ